MSSARNVRGRGRADFSERTRRLLAQRAAFRCSNPQCGALTIGPGVGHDDISDTGTAAHIFAAASGGPRGTGGLSAQERSDISNGIWMCATCGRLIDVNAGNRYSASLLRSWKDLHEHRTRLEQAGQTQPFGWVQSLEVVSHYILLPGVIQLSKLNLLFGMNDSGKTRLLHLLRSLTSPHLLMGSPYPADLSCSITWFDPALRKAQVEVQGERLHYHVDGRRAPLPPRPYRVLTFGQDIYRRDSFRSGVTTVSGIAEFLDVDPWTARTVIDSMPALLPDAISDVAVDGDFVWINCRRGSWGGQGDEDRWACWFYALAVFAELQARMEPTILVLDEPFLYMHRGPQQKIMELFESATWTFQVILAEHSRVAYERRLHGWSAAVLVQAPGLRSRISQDDADLERLGGN